MSNLFMSPVFSGEEIQDIRSERAERSAEYIHNLETLANTARTAWRNAITGSPVTEGLDQLPISKERIAPEVEVIETKEFLSTLASTIDWRDLGEDSKEAATNFLEAYGRAIHAAAEEDAERVQSEINEKVKGITFESWDEKLREYHRLIKEARAASSKEIQDKIIDNILYYVDEVTSEFDSEEGEAGDEEGDEEGDDGYGDSEEESDDGYGDSEEESDDDDGDEADEPGGNITGDPSDPTDEDEPPSEEAPIDKLAEEFIKGLKYVSRHVGKHGQSLDKFRHSPVRTQYRMYSKVKNPRNISLRDLAYGKKFVMPQYANGRLFSRQFVKPDESVFRLHLLIDHSGSMCNSFKQRHVKAILDYLIQELEKNKFSFELHVSYFTYAIHRTKIATTLDELKRILVEHRAPNGGGTDVGECIKQAVGTHKLKSSEKLTVLVVNDGQDRFVPKVIPKTTVFAFSLEEENSDLDELCRMNGGKYSFIADEEDKV